MILRRVNNSLGLAKAGVPVKRITCLNFLKIGKRHYVL
jgi:hypothetical protein